MEGARQRGATCGSGGGRPGGFFNEFLSPLPFFPLPFSGEGERPCRPLVVLSRGVLRLGRWPVAMARVGSLGPLQVDESASALTLPAHL